MGLKEKLFTELESTRQEYHLLVDSVPVERLFRYINPHLEIHASQNPGKIELNSGIISARDWSCHTVLP